MGPLGKARDSAYGRLHDLSLTTRLVTVVAVLVLTAYVITSTLTVMLLRDYLLDRTDQDLVRYITPLTQEAMDRITGANRQSETFVPPTPYYLVITPRAAGPAYMFGSGESPPDLSRIEWSDERIGGGAFTVDSVDGHTHWRVLAGRLQNGEATAAVALPTTPMEGTVKQLVVLTGVVGLGTLLAVVVLSWFAVRRAFRPLRRIEDTASAIAAGDLTRRIPQRNAHDEVASLSSSLNVMLGRIEQSFAVREASEERMRRFVADASHELRTPLATVKGYAELYRAGGVSDPAAMTTAMRRIEDEATRMARLVEDLLLLTRLDSQRDLERQPVDLAVLAADVVQDARVRAPERTIQLSHLAGRWTPAHTSGDDFALRQVLTNLVANALAHTPDQTPIEVVVGQPSDQPAARVVVEVRDHGPGIPPDVADRVFERFYRADPSRARGNGGGTGLGLAIVAAIVSRHGGTVRHRPTPGGGATFRVELPASPQPASVDA